MQNNEIFYRHPLNAQATQGHRILLDGVYFSVESHLLFENQIKDVLQAKQFLEKAPLELRLERFEDQFRAKMRQALQQKSGETTGDAQSLEQMIILVSVDVFQKKIVQIEEKYSHLSVHLEKFISENLAIHLEQPFYSIFPNLVDPQTLKENHAKLKKQKRLVPYHSFYPFSGPIEASIKEDVDCILDDLYCTNPSCDCNEVTCIMISFDPQSGNEIVHGGFKYHLEKKSFKVLSDFPTNYNAQQCFKSFSTQHFVELSLLLKSRYQLMRKG